MGVVHLYTTTVTMPQCGVARVKGKGVGKARFLGRKRLAVNEAGTASLCIAKLLSCNYCLKIRLFLACFSPLAWVSGW